MPRDDDDLDGESGDHGVDALVLGLRQGVADHGCQPRQLRRDQAGPGGGATGIPGRVRAHPHSPTTTAYGGSLAPWEVLR